MQNSPANGQKPLTIFTRVWSLFKNILLQRYTFYTFLLLLEFLYENPE